MKLVGAVMCLAAGLSVAKAQAVDATVCDVLAKPASFDGKTVRIKGTVIAGMDEFAIRDKSCGQAVNGIWLEYPAGTKGKAGPLYSVQMQPAKNGPAGTAAPAAVKLDKNKDWKQFDSLLSAGVKNAASCPGCVKNVVTATLVGRLDGVDTTGAAHAGGKVSGIRGYGSLNTFAARLVLESVSDVTAQEIDYNKTPLASEGGDPSAKPGAFPQGSAPQVSFARAINAWGAEGDNNGVSLGFGAGDEVHDWSSQASGNSPDGVIYNAVLDGDRGKYVMGGGLAFVGSQVADLRDATTWSEGPMQMEYRAWQTAVVNAIAYRQKALVAPGGYVLWDASWPEADRSSLVDKGIRAYLAEWSVYAK